MKGIFNIIGFGVIWLLIAACTFGIGLIPLGLWIAYLLVGADARRDTAEVKLKSTLMPGEAVITGSMQHRAFALMHRRVAVAITDSRIIIIRRGFLGGFKMSDIQWKDLKDARIEQNVLEGICGSNLAFLHFNPGVGWMGVDGVKSEPAAEIYSRAQAEEHAWEEKRRVRSMEEVRAASGGVVVHTGQPASTASTAGGVAHSVGNAMLEHIQQAKALMDSGVISDAEFQEMKSKILAAG